MTTLLGFWRILKGVPLIAYALVLGAGLVTAHVIHDARHAASEYRRGKSDAYASAHFDSVLATITFKQHNVAVARTDTVIQTVTRVARRVDSVIVRVPDTLRLRFPIVDTLIVESRTLAATVDTLTHQIDTERATARLRIDVLESNLTGARLVIVAKSDTITTLAKRPTWRRLMVWSGSALAGGFVVGLLR